MIYYKLVLPFYRKAAKKMADDCTGYIEKGSKFLDFGSGSGIVSLEFKKKFNLDLIGVDIVDNRVVDMELKLIDGKTLPFEDGSFDAVLISYVLHHADEPVRLLKEAKRVVRSGGRVIVFEDLYKGMLAKIICKIHGSTYGFLFEHHGGKELINFKNQKQWDEIFRTLGFKQVFAKRVSARIHPVEKRMFVLEKQ
jgi:ubiquinone/menaquinone biosynthesis C-methylase UbiE